MTGQPDDGANGVGRMHSEYHDGHHGVAAAAGQAPSQMMPVDMPAHAVADGWSDTGRPGNALAGPEAICAFLTRSSEPGGSLSSESSASHDSSHGGRHRDSAILASIPPDHCVSVPTKLIGHAHDGGGGATVPGGAIRSSRSWAFRWEAVPSIETCEWLCRCCGKRSFSLKAAFAHARLHARDRRLLNVTSRKLGGQDAAGPSHGRRGDHGGKASAAAAADEEAEAASEEDAPARSQAQAATRSHQAKRTAGSSSAFMPPGTSGGNSLKRRHRDVYSDTASRDRVSPQKPSAPSASKTDSTRALSPSRSRKATSGDEPRHGASAGASAGGPGSSRCKSSSKSSLLPAAAPPSKRARTGERDNDDEDAVGENDDDSEDEPEAASSHRAGSHDSSDHHDDSDGDSQHGSHVKSRVGPAWHAGQRLGKGAHDAASWAAIRAADSRAGPRSAKKRSSSNSDGGGGSVGSSGNSSRSKSGAGGSAPRPHDSEAVFLPVSNVKPGTRDPLRADFELGDVSEEPSLSHLALPKQHLMFVPLGFSAMKPKDKPDLVAGGGGNNRVFCCKICGRRNKTDSVAHRHFRAKHMGLPAAVARTGSAKYKVSANSGPGAGASSGSRRADSAASSRSGAESSNAASRSPSLLSLGLVAGRTRARISSSDEQEAAAAIAASLQTALPMPVRAGQPDPTRLKTHILSDTAKDDKFGVFSPPNEPAPAHHLLFVERIRQGGTVYLDYGHGAVSEATDREWCCTRCGTRSTGDAAARKHSESCSPGRAMTAHHDDDDDDDVDSEDFVDSEAAAEEGSESKSESENEDDSGEASASAESDSVSEGPGRRHRSKVVHIPLEQIVVGKPLSVLPSHTLMRVTDAITAELRIREVPQQHLLVTTFTSGTSGTSGASGGLGGASASSARSSVPVVPNVAEAGNAAERRWCCTICGRVTRADRHARVHSHTHK